MNQNRRHLVLLGAGHAHLAVLQAFARQPVDGVDLTLVTPDRSTLYSGMIPGWLAGDCTLDACRWHFCRVDRRTPSSLGVGS